MEKSFGVDTSNVITIPVDTIEQTILEMTKVFSDIKEKNLQGQILLILDSIGGLSTDKEIEGAENNKLSQDMGLRAKWIRSLMRTMKAKCALTRCPFVVINHEIENPNAMYESIFKQQGGGHAIEFFSSVMINVGKKKEKQDAQNEFDETSALTKAGVTGQFIKCFTHKNRCAIPHKEVLCYLNYINGIDPYSGLKELIDMIPTVIYTKSAQGEIGKGYTYYLKNGEEEIKLGKYSEWRNDVAIWEKILPSLNEFVKSEFSYKLHI
jgi:RecA/RadA recombinase